MTQVKPIEIETRMLKVIACEVFTREACLCTATSRFTIDLEFTPKGAHNDPDYFRKVLQERIDAAEESEKDYEAIALCLGICGNSTVGLQSRGTPLILPRAHDCCTLFLGSRERYKECFGNCPSSQFSSAGYLEHGGDYVREAEGVNERMGFNKSFDDFVEEHGEENAKYLWDTLHPGTKPGEDNKIYFIEIPEFADLGYSDQCRKQAELDGKEFVELEGSMDMIKKLINGDWNNEEFLTIKNGEQIKGVYDLEEVVSAKQVNAECGVRNAED